MLVGRWDKESYHQQQGFADVLKWLLNQLGRVSWRYGGGPRRFRHGTALRELLLQETDIHVHVDGNQAPEEVQLDESLRNEEITPGAARDNRLIRLCPRRRAINQKFKVGILVVETVEGEETERCALSKLANMLKNCYYIQILVIQDWSISGCERTKVCGWGK